MFDGGVLKSGETSQIGDMDEEGVIDVVVICS